MIWRGNILGKEEKYSRSFYFSSYLFLHSLACHLNKTCTETHMKSLIHAMFKTVMFSERVLIHLFITFKSLSHLQFNLM